MGYCARPFSGTFIAPSRFGKYAPPGTPSYLTEDAVRRHIPFGFSALTRVSFRQNKNQSPKADGNVLAIRVKTAEVQRITTPLPLLLAFLVASHITELEGVVNRPLAKRGHYRGHDGSPQESDTAVGDCRKPKASHRASQKRPSFVREQIS